jgi:hypothetical protein
MMATNAVRDPQRTPLAAATSIQLSSSSATVDINVASKDDPSVPPNTKSQTCVVEDRRASSSVSTSRHAANSALSCPVASSRRLAS